MAVKARLRHKDSNPLGRFDGWLALRWHWSVLIFGGTFPLIRTIEIRFRQVFVAEEKRLRMNLTNPMAIITIPRITIVVPISWSTVRVFPHKPDEQDELMTETVN
jgi:hypothetical protein